LLFLKDTELIWRDSFELIERRAPMAVMRRFGDGAVSCIATGKPALPDSSA
jgi:hypothetical protein